MRVSLLAAVALVLVLAGCSGKPTAADARKIVESKCEGCARVVDFRKTNGQDGELFGVRMYSLDYEAVIEFTKDSVEREVGGKFDGVTPLAARVPVFDLATRTTRRKGFRRTVTGSVLFEMTEKGWRPSFD